MPVIDAALAATFLRCLGKDPAATRLRAFPHKDNPDKAHPDTNPNGIKARAGAFDLSTAARWQSEGRGVYCVIGNGGDKDATITSCPAVFLEWDNQPLSWQLTAWQTFGLGEPSLIVRTGGKSAHLYWVLDTPCTPDEWRPVQAALIDITDADTTIRNPSRVMRLPGAWYVGPDGIPVAQSTIHSAPGHRYTLEQVQGWILAAADQQQQAPISLSTGGSRAGTGESRFKLEDAQLRESRYLPHTLDDIREALSLIPPRPGSGTGTYPVYRNILWGLIRACDEAGADRDTAISLMAAHSPDGWDVRQVADSGGDHIQAATFWYHARQAGWRPRCSSCSTSATQGHGAQQGATPAGEGTDHQDASQHPAGPPPEPPRHEQIQTHLDSLLDQLLDPSDPWAHQQATRAELWNLGVRGNAIDDRLYYALAERWGLPLAQAHSGARRGRSITDPIDSPAEDLLPGFLLWQRDHVLFGPGGSGKTMAAAAMAASVIKGQPFLDVQIPPTRTGRVLWIGSDGGEGARAMVLEYLQDLGLDDDPAIREGLTIWSAEPADGLPSWCCSPRGLHELREELETGGYGLVIIDSLKAVLELAGINFGIGPVGTLMRLMQALVGRHCSLLWLHHPAGGAKAGGKGVSAAAGNQNINQIPSGVHQLQRISSDRGPCNEWNVHKLRGSQSREFRYRLCEDGFEVIQGEVTTCARAQVLDAIANRAARGIPTATPLLVAELLGVNESTIRNNLTWLRKRALIRKSGTAWRLTPKGDTALTRYVNGEMHPW